MERALKIYFGISFAFLVLVLASYIILHDKRIALAYRELHIPFLHLYAVYAISILQIANVFLLLYLFAAKKELLQGGIVFYGIYFVAALIYAAIAAITILLAIALKGYSGIH